MVGRKVIMEIWCGSISERRAYSKEESLERLLSPEKASPEPQIDIRAAAIELGFAADDVDYNRRLRDVAISLVKRQLERMCTPQSDLLQMVESLDDLNVAINLIEERLYEWSLFYGMRCRGEELARALSGREGIGLVARSLLELTRAREDLEELLETRARELAPNLSAILGPVLAARLISRAGGLEKLAMLPASTIQVIGAERSLFRHLRGKAPSPKHGIIFRHPLIQSSPKRLRGRIARALAAKLAIAARIDLYSGTLDPGIAQALNERVSQIRNRATQSRREDK
ncbi:rRNA biogenesis protein Nop56/Nop58 [Methanothrix thermoacetophila PT]|uniref:rRNA biogenesis protein Nop56/Nop58 n=2 Tax=Methanotrichaceae TaxID=143067 RepID=A0B7E6_METTP|nr:rRNA biogenesis protein Nop56/Nop58 [Methanothrix thermoacetophila PT]